MNLNDLLRIKGIDPQRVLVLRHRPKEPELNKVLPWLAEERPDLFNAYQQTQAEKLERAMADLCRTGYVASFIGTEPGKALFVGLYAIESSRGLTRKEYFEVPAYAELESLGMTPSPEKKRRKVVLWFNLVLADFYAQWKGKLVIRWPPPERSWWRRAHRNEIAILSISEENALATAMPAWDSLDLSWKELSALPLAWRAAISQWRGVYYIFDASDGKGYVGSAYGRANLLGRWTSYAARGDGGNRLLKGRDPSNFRFTILERVSPDMEPEGVIRLEASWKDRLHTRLPYGLNVN